MLIVGHCPMVVLVELVVQGYLGVQDINPLAAIIVEAKSSYR